LTKANTTNNSGQLHEEMIVRDRTLKIVTFFCYTIGLDLHVNFRFSVWNALADLGHEVTWVSPSVQYLGASERPLKFRVETLMVARIPLAIRLPFFLLFAVRHLVRSIRNCDVVVVDVSTMPALFPILLARRMLGGKRPAVCLGHVCPPVETAGIRKILYALRYYLSIKLTAAFFEKVFFTSPLAALMASAKVGLPANKVAVWTASVDTTLFRSQRRKRALVRKKLAIPRSAVLVLYHGHISVGRGVMEMVMAFERLRAVSEDATLMLLGDGPARGEVIDYVRANRLEDIVRIDGPVDYSEVPSYVAACDVGLVPLPDNAWWRYQSPLKLIEYLAMSKPVIVSDIAAHRWIVGKAPVAVYLSGTDSIQISEGVLDFLRMRRTLKPGMGRQIAESFSDRKIAEMLEAQMLSMVQGRPVG
jgi:glycosyltransferase involved in cell wall biosynthesis